MYVIRRLEGVKAQTTIAVAEDTATLMPASPSDRAVIMLHNPSTTDTDIFYVKMSSGSAPTISATDCIERIGAGETKSYQVGKSVKVYVWQTARASLDICVQEGY
jgi:hypothetical protein